jgi:hypothetical protein
MAALVSSGGVATHEGRSAARAVKTVHGASRSRVARAAEASKKFEAFHMLV